MRKLTVLLILLMLAPTAAAETRLAVAATTPNMAMLTRAIGADQVEVQVLAPGDRDIHLLEARPGMMAAVRRADLLVAVGAELEAGWLPAVLQRSNNPRVLPGSAGYFEAAGAVELRETGLPADRALGDVHPTGNPHVYLDPLRMATVALALAERLGELDRGNAALFRDNAERFADAIRERLPDWQQRTQAAPGVVLYHKEADYLMERLGVEVLAYIEPLPGIPPTARHLRALVDGLQGHDGVIFHMVYEPARGPDFLARELGWPVSRMRSQVDQDGTRDDYIALIESWVRALERT